MRMPSFSAENSLYKTSEHYSTTVALGTPARDAAVQPQANCVPVCRWICTSDGLCGWFCYYDCTGGSSLKTLPQFRRS
jgi:hypothetical protein